MKDKKIIEQRQQKFSNFEYLAFTLGFGFFSLYVGYFYFKDVWFISDLWKFIGYMLIGLFIFIEIRKWYVYRR